MGSTAAILPSILERLPGQLPEGALPDSVDFEAVSRQILEKFPRFDEKDFAQDALWRDTYALTGTIRTFYFRKAVAERWTALAQEHGLSRAKIFADSTKVLRIEGNNAWVDCRYQFTTSTPATECSGYLSLSWSADGGWKIWVIRTILEQLDGHPNVDEAPSAPDQSSHDISFNDHGESLDAASTHNGDIIDGSQLAFEAVIIGGGQCGLSTAGRLQALGVSYVVLEKNARVGDAWRLRYESARLHTVREYAHLPFERSFGPEYGEYLGKDALGEVHEAWARKYGINIWLSTTATSGRWDEEAGQYFLTICKKGRLRQISAKHVVFATGAGSQTPVMPNLQSRNLYDGPVLHSAAYTSSKAWQGKSGVVVGTANTGHDIADDMYEAGMKVTMIQRSRTFVLPVEFIENRYHALYNNKILTELSDRAMFTNPISIARLVSARTFHRMAREQPERYAALERAGFKVDPFGDIQDAINIRLGGHYIDVGTSAKIGQGFIKVKSDAAAVRYTEKGLGFADGSEVSADVIVFATGFVGNLRQHVEKMFGPEVADRAGDCFGLNEEGEVLGAFKPLNQPGMWYIGGALGHARFYSRFIALSIKADVIGHPLPVYREKPYHLS